MTNFFIPSSKTDTFRQGKYVFLSKEISDVYNLFFRYTKMAQLGYTKNHFLLLSHCFFSKDQEVFFKKCKVVIRCIQKYCEGGSFKPRY